MINVLLALGVNNISTNRPLCQNNERMGRTTNIPNLLFPQYTHCFVSFRGAELGGWGGGGFSPQSFGDLFSFWEFFKNPFFAIYCSPPIKNLFPPTLVSFTTQTFEKRYIYIYIFSFLTRHHHQELNSSSKI